MKEVVIREDVTRIPEREHIFTRGVKTEKICDYCEESYLFQIGIGLEEQNNEVPLYQCRNCRYNEVIVNDNKNAIIVKKKVSI